MRYSILIFLCFFSISFLRAQVAIGTTQIEHGVMLQLESEDKGLSIPNVSLTSILDVMTISPSNVDGLMVYNTLSNGAGDTAVSPGYYHWDEIDGIWKRLFNSGFTTQYIQTNEQRAINQTTEHILPGLNQNFIAPYSGLYQFIFIGYYGTGFNEDNAFAASSFASFKLQIDDTTVSECFVTSRSMTTTPGAVFQVLSRQGMLVHQVELVEGQTYNLKIRAREWAEENSNGDIGLGTGYGYFGLDSTTYAGSRGRTGAAYASLTINLLNQF